MIHISRRMNILFVKLSSIGDIVHTMPALAAVKRARPDANVSWVAERRSAELLRNNGLLDHLIEVDTKALRSGRTMLGKTPGSALKQFRELRDAKPDLSLDFQGLFKSATIARISGAPRRFGFDKENLREPQSSFLLTDPIAVDQVQNVIFKNIDLAEAALREFSGEPAFALDRSRIEFPIETGDEEKAYAAKTTEAAGGPFAILNPGGGWVTKLWRPSDYGMLADRIREELGLIPVVPLAPGEEKLADEVESSSKGGVFKTRAGLKEFYELAKIAAVYVGGDTGPTHIAVAAGCPVVGIFGPTEWWRNGSIRPDDICVARKELACRIDCHRRTCGKWVCMDIPVENVFDAVKKRLSRISEVGRS